MSSVLSKRRQARVRWQFDALSDCERAISFWIRVLPEDAARTVRTACKVFVCQFTWVLLFAALQAPRHCVVVRFAALGCMQLHLSFYRLCLHVVVFSMVMFCCPSARIYHVFDLGHPWYTFFLPLRE